jgi:hypothetical protein
MGIAPRFAHVAMAGIRSSPRSTGLLVLDWVKPAKMPRQMASRVVGSAGHQTRDGDTAE